jgi:hypothetical protein
MRVFAALFMVEALGYAGAVSAEPLAWLGSCAILVPSWIRAVKQLRNLQRAEEVAAGEDPEALASVPEEMATIKSVSASPKLESATKA